MTGTSCAKHPKGRWRQKVPVAFSPPLRGFHGHHRRDRLAVSPGCRRGYSGDERRWVSVDAVFNDVQAVHFFFRADTQAHGGVDCVEHNEAHREGPREGGGNTHGLDTKLAEAVAGQQAGVLGEQADRQGPPDTANAVDGNSSHRVVHADPVDQEAGNHHDQARHKTGQGGVRDAQAVAAGGDRRRGGLGGAAVG